MALVGSDRKRVKLTPSEGDCGSDEGAFSAVGQVFGNDYLRQMIIGLVVNTANITSDDICSVRVVCKSWLRDVTKVLVTSDQPLFDVRLDLTNSLNETTYTRKHGAKALDRFVSTMKSSVDPIIPLFRLQIREEFFCTENHQSTLNFLTDDGISGLLEMNISVPKNGVSLPFKHSQQFLFPRLKRLSVCVRKGKKVPLLQNTSVMVADSSRSFFVPFIPAILKGSPNLSEFLLLGNNEQLVPTGLNNLVLPATLKRLCSDFKLNSIQLEMLVRNPLPKLTHLSFRMRQVASPNELLFQILDNVKSTLRHFELLDEDGPHENIPVSHSLRFPVMNRLETFAFYSTQINVEAQKMPMNAFLPVLKSLTVTMPTVDHFRKWTDNGCFSNVVNLALRVCDHESSDAMAFNVKEMQALVGSFPNLKDFSYSGNFIKREALQLFFMKMSQLTKLTIEVSTNGLETADHWDSTLIGVPTSAVSQIRDNPHLWQNVEEFMKSKGAEISSPSIRSLTSLEIFELKSPFIYLEPDMLPNQPLVSDLTLSHAFMIMPSLKHVFLDTAFMPTTDIGSRLKFCSTPNGLMISCHCQCDE